MSGLVCKIEGGDVMFDGLLGFDFMLFLDAARIITSESSKQESLSIIPAEFVGKWSGLCRRSPFFSVAFDRLRLRFDDNLLIKGLLKHEF